MFYFHTYLSRFFLGAKLLVPFFLSLSISCTQVVKKSHQMTTLFFQKGVWVNLSSIEWKLYHFEQNKFHFVTWEQENESERKKEPQILRLDLCSQWDEIFLKGNSCFHWIFTKHLFQYSIRIEEISHQWKRM